MDLTRRNELASRLRLAAVFLNEKNEMGEKLIPMAKINKFLGKLDLVDQKDLIK